MLPVYDRARIDHIIHFSQGSDVTWQTYERLGFNLGPETTFSEQAKDVHSRLISFGHSRLELMAMRPGADASSFKPAAMFVHARGQGLLGLAVTTPDSDNGAERAQKYGLFPVGEMTFKSVNADGGTGDYKLNFYVDPKAMLSYLQAAKFRPHAAETHPNGANRIHALIFVAPEPTDVSGTAHFIGGKDGCVDKNGVRTFYDRSAIEISCLTHDACDKLFDGMLGGKRHDTAYMAALSLITRTPAELVEHLSRENVPFRILDGGRIVVPAAAACGTILEFIPEVPG